MTSKEILQKINTKLNKSLYYELMNVERLALSDNTYVFYNIYFDIFDEIFHVFSIGPNTEPETNPRLKHLLTIDRRDLTFNETKRNSLINNLPELVKEDMELIKRKLEINTYFERRT